MAWTKRHGRWFPALVAIWFLAACSASTGEPELPPGVVEGSPEVAPPVTSSAAPSPVATSGSCANESATAEDPAHRIGTAREADVDGDGDLDSVALASDPAAEEGCQTFLVVDLGDAVAAAPVWEVGREGGLPQPQLHGLVDIDDEPGAEILVDEAAGASTQFVGAFVFVDGDLERITVLGPSVGGEIEGSADLFPYGGSVGHIEAVDCVDERVVVSVATPSSDQEKLARGIYDVERRFFVLEEATLEAAERERAEVTADQLDRFPEFGSAPFGSC